MAAASDRQKVLVHHPDKQQQSSGEGEGDDHFKCIKIGEREREAVVLTGLTTLPPRSI